MQKIIKDKSFYLEWLKITIPIALQSLVGVAVSATDTIMLGQLDEINLTASAAANQPQFIFMLLIFGMASGGTVLTSQYYGKGDYSTIRKVIALVMRVTMLVSVLLTAVVLIFPRQIMTFYLDDAAAIEYAVKYLRIVGWGYFFFGVANAFSGLIRSVEIVLPSVVISVISFFVNLIGNYLLIFGNFGCPAMGIEGAALATLFSRVTEMLAFSVFVLIIDKKLRFRIKDLVSKTGGLLRDYARFSLPVVGNELLWGLGTSMQAAIMGQLSSEMMAANSVVSVLQQLVNVGIIGSATAGCVLIGKRMGRGDTDDAKAAAMTLEMLSVIIGIVGATMIFLGRDAFLSCYNLTPSTEALARQMLGVLSVVVFFISISTNLVVGVLRGAGDTRFAFVLEIGLLWGVAIPSAAILGFVVGAPMVAVFAALKSDEVIKAFIGVPRSMGANTFKNVTR